MSGVTKKTAGSEREPQVGDVLSGSYVMAKAFGFDVVRRACRLESGLYLLVRRLYIHTPVFLYFFIFVVVFRYFLLTDGRLQLKLVLHLTCVYCTYTGLLTLQTPLVCSLVDNRWSRNNQWNTSSKPESIRSQYMKSFLCKRENR